jgi:exodeoxyribonuclease VII large subunit
MADSPGLFDQLLKGGAREETPDALTVTELTERIKSELIGMGRFSVEGELTRITVAQSGHVYFTLKDDGASIACIVWRGARERATGGLKPAEGDHVRVTGKLDVYAPRGGYSLIVERIEPVGLGKQLLELEALKRELKELGWMDRKRPLPRWPRRVGVVTSRDAAALRDFLRTRSLRWPGYPVRICHTPVQGPGSAVSIARAIDLLGASGVDVIVVTRGGGSLEDLWAFNERPVAQAIWNCPVPVVNAVGHETDTTLADWIADHRAHTPTDAANVVFPDRAELVAQLMRVGGYLDRAVEDLLADRVARLERVRASRMLSQPVRLLEGRAERLTETLRRMQAALSRSAHVAESRLERLGNALEKAGPRVRVSVMSERTRALAERLKKVAPRLAGATEQRLQLAARSLEGVSPLRVLARGYSTTSMQAADGARASLVDVDQLTVGMAIETRLAKGRLRSTVTELLPSDEEPA